MGGSEVEEQDAHGTSWLLLPRYISCRYSAGCLMTMMMFLLDLARMKGLPWTCQSYRNVSLLSRTSEKDSSSHDGICSCCVAVLS